MQSREELEDITNSNLLEVLFLLFLGYEKYKSNNNNKKNYRNGIRRRKLSSFSLCKEELDKIIENI